MNPSVKRLAWIVPVLALGLAGCVRLHGPEDVTRRLSGVAGVDLEQEVGFTVTRSGIWLAKKGLKWSDEEDIPSLDGLKRVEVGVYQVAEEREPGARLSMDLFPRSWLPWVRVQDDDEEVFVLVHNDGRAEEIDAMLVVVAAADEWVVVRMRGDLDRIMEDAIRLALDQAERPDLTERAIAEHEAREREDADDGQS